MNPLQAIILLILIGGALAITLAGAWLVIWDCIKERFKENDTLR
jgi:type II secretory pathway component PulM